MTIIRIIFDINHPAHVHYFKYLIKELSLENDVMVTASDKEIISRLLTSYEIDFVPIKSYGNSIVKKMFSLITTGFNYYKKINKFNPDIIVGFGSIRAAHASFFMRKPCLNFEDTEHSMEQIILYLPFVDSVITPHYYKAKHGRKHIVIPSLMELGSLSNSRFCPNPEVLIEYNLAEGENFSVIRFVSWQASHDYGEYGLSDKLSIVQTLERFGKVIISSEGVLPNELSGYETIKDPTSIHSLLFYSQLYVGEGATMAVEAALVGTPAVYVSSLSHTMGNLEYLEKNYGALFSYVNQTDALNKCIEILTNQDSKTNSMTISKKIQRDNSDFVDFAKWLILDYPSSKRTMKQ